MDKNRERQLTLDLLLCELMCIVGVYTMQEIDVFIRVELRHFAFGSWFGSLRGSSQLGPRALHQGNG